MKNKILIINGSPNAESGQSGIIANAIATQFDDKNDFEILTLALEQDMTTWETKLAWAEGFIFVSGCYWDSWGSPLQSFLEKTTQWEVSPLWLGKPAAVIITMHSVGGKGVLSRLQGVLNTLGVSIPPLCGLVYSLTSHLLMKEKNTHADDFWQLSEIKLMIANVNEQINCIKKQKPLWATWDVDRGDVTRAWLTQEEIKGLNETRR